MTNEALNSAYAKSKTNILWALYFCHSINKSKLFSKQRLLQLIQFAFLCTHLCELVRYLIAWDWAMWRDPYKRNQIWSFVQHTVQLFWHFWKEIRRISTEFHRPESFKWAKAVCGYVGYHPQREVDYCLLSIINRTRFSKLVEGTRVFTEASGSIEERFIRKKPIFRNWELVAWKDHNQIKNCYTANYFSLIIRNRR